MEKGAQTDGAFNDGYGGVCHFQIDGVLDGVVGSSFSDVFGIDDLGLAHLDALLERNGLGIQVPIYIWVGIVVLHDGINGNDDWRWQ